MSRKLKVAPKTVEPKTVEPKTVEPKTVEPKTVEPKTEIPEGIDPNKQGKIVHTSCGDLNLSMALLRAIANVSWSFRPIWLKDVYDSVNKAIDPRETRFSDLAFAYKAKDHAGNKGNVKKSLARMVLLGHTKLAAKIAAEYPFDSKSKGETDMVSGFKSIATLDMSKVGDLVALRKIAVLDSVWQKQAEKYPVVLSV